MHTFTRRTFIKTSAVAAAGVALSARSWGQVPGANGDVRVAVLGLNGRGKNHLASLRDAKGARVVALCDPDSAVLAQTKNAVDKKTGALALNWDDEIVKGAGLTRDGEIVHPSLKG